MKNIIYTITILLILFSFNTVNAATIKEVKYVDNQVSLSGNGSGEVVVVLFSQDNLPLYLTTATAVGDTFSITLPEIEGLSPGNYTVKTSNYDGSNVATKILTIENVGNPQTIDNISIYIIIGIFSLLGIVIFSIVLYKKNKININIKHTTK